MDTINPLMSFSSEDIANMDREVEDIFNESESEGEPDNKVSEQHKVDRSQVQNLESADESSSSSADTLPVENITNKGRSKQ
jgi:RNA polymerase II subunit A-like phosphatase